MAAFRFSHLGSDESTYPDENVGPESDACLSIAIANYAVKLTFQHHCSSLCTCIQISRSTIMKAATVYGNKQNSI
jgi:hypothetical protein